ncbi:MAG: glycine cleavage system aminomethyltransferase GcvT [Firmicutes bacterium]|nr:glycine cleavage system aminomethyltransferase GcvT [Bacillota bacterium]
MQTPLTSWHRRHGAKMTTFGGYEMPIEYQGILEEHRLVRESVGMFDVSHMGEFLVQGPKAPDFLDRLVTKAPSRLQPGQALYTFLCAPDAGTVDDLLVYRRGTSEFWLVVNAANRAGDWAWIRDRLPTDGVELIDRSDETALIAVQGPKASEILGPLAGNEVLKLKPFRFFNEVRVANTTVMISRTGYTGEDGFEIYASAHDAEGLWEQLYRQGIPPIGLGARDTLRLEARLPLYGHELSRSISPLEAGLARFVDLEQSEHFVGQEALRRQREVGLASTIVGLELTAPGVARSGFSVVDGDQTIGVVTSGSFSPTLKKAVALALVPMKFHTVGTPLELVIRGRRVPARVAATPFYQRNRSAR